MNYLWKKAISILLILTLGGVMMFGLSGCGGTKYKVDYCGQKDCYSNAKDSYRAGQTVTLYYELIATDTDYSFYLDGKSIKFNYNEKKGYEIMFVMPQHDVTLECRMENSMVYHPDPEDPDDRVMLVDYYTAVVGTDGCDHYTEKVLYEYSDEQAELTVYSKYDGEDETSESYLVPYEAVEKCYEIIRDNKLGEWNDKYDTPIDGAVTAVRYREDDGSYIRVSTDAMPDGGEGIMDSIGGVMNGYLKDEYKIEE
ncbi:MAG: hypothetical protein IJH32_04125 [Ruminococcus sp.]|nr:hypothetical protein [Ruminococcus sp.]